MVCHVYYRPGDPVPQQGQPADSTTAAHSTVYCRPQQSPLRPFPHKIGRKLWGLPLVTHRSCIAVRGPHLVGLGFAVPGPGVPLAPPSAFRPVSDSRVGDFQ
jgi:hypothetical protein